MANIGIGVVLLAVLYRHRLSDPQPLAGPDQALARYRTHYPLAGGKATVAADGRAALLELADGTIGLVEQRGRRWNVRAVSSSEFLGFRREADEAITLRFADFGWPRSRVLLADADTRERWIGRLTALRSAGAGPEGWGEPGA
ncbi:MAG: hypothetical protein ACYCT1_00210 [Steroidobacteraceae bacterium]